MVRKISEREFIMGSKAMRASRASRPLHALKERKAARRPKLKVTVEDKAGHFLIKERDIFNMPKMVVVALSRKDSLKMLKQQEKLRKYRTAAYHFRSRYPGGDKI